jgi:DNA-binding response OmpR family regulator
VFALVRFWKCFGQVPDNELIKRSKNDLPGRLMTKKDTRDVLMRTLSLAGFAVKGAENLYFAIEVLKQAEDKKVGMILLDWNLSGMSMDQFLKQVRQIQPEITIVLSTAAFRVETKARQLRLTRWLPKPVLPEALIQVATAIAAEKQNTTFDSCA